MTESEASGFYSLFLNKVKDIILHDNTSFFNVRYIRKKMDITSNNHSMIIFIGRALHDLANQGLLIEKNGSRGHEYRKVA
jgi:hypothetical protein